MANNFFNLNQFYIFNYAQHPEHENHNSNMACRLCNQVFTTYQSLITHLESHVAQEILAMRRLSHINPQGRLIPNPLQPNFPRPMLMQGTRNFAESRDLQTPPQQLVVRPRPRTNSFPYANLQVVASQPVQHPPQVMQYAGNNVAKMAQLQAAPIHEGDMEMEVSPVDGTKPYIDLPDKPFDNNVCVNSANTNGGTLNLALRL